MESEKYIEQAAFMALAVASRGRQRKERAPERVKQVSIRKPSRQVIRAELRSKCHIEMAGKYGGEKRKVRRSIALAKARLEYRETA